MFNPTHVSASASKKTESVEASNCSLEKPTSECNGPEFPNKLLINKPQMSYRAQKQSDLRRNLRLAQFKKTKADTVFIFDPRVHMHLSKADIQNLEKIEEYSQINWMGEVHQLSTGSSFGELALINNEPRKATVQCISDCYFAVLEKKDYVGMLRKYELRIFNQKLDFLNNLPFLKHYTQL